MMVKAFELAREKVPFELREIQPMYLNDYKKKCSFVNPDPVAIVAAILKDLTILLGRYSSKGKAMFYHTQKYTRFVDIEKQIASLRSKNFLAKSDGTKWLQTDEEKLSFFINLHNFLVLFGLCKYNRTSFPSTQLEWTNFRKSLLVRVGGYTFSAFEIEHAVLRAAMDSPNLPSPYLDVPVPFPTFKPRDPRTKLAYKKKEAFLEFALYIPTKSSAPLRIYKADRVAAQIRENAERYMIKTVRVNGSKKVLMLPKMLEWYASDFAKGDTKEDLLLSITNRLTNKTSQKLSEVLVMSVIKEVKYDKYNWNFAYEFIES
eukprot:TRINITY_DN16323_c0_g1_i2.p1 TRINITY_DN16323_c0_g1~~TRINITY_DN16323_c0_g1_i2.p1  ORF type:complete len:317 (-),score=52.09 TRINITY_DN16323_c0_g1_i2:110-1060(-)